MRADEQFGVRRGDLTSEAPRRADWRGGARPFTPARSSTELELAAPRPVIVRCRACSFSVSLPLAEARQAFAAHKCAPVPVIAEAP